MHQYFFHLMDKELEFKFFECIAAMAIELYSYTSYTMTGLSLSLSHTHTHTHAKEFRVKQQLRLVHFLRAKTKIEPTFFGPMSWQFFSRSRKMTRKIKTFFE